MDSFGTITAPDTVKLERLLPASIDTVWAYLTENDKRSRWLASGDIDLRPGGRVDYVFDHATLSATPETVPEKYQESCGKSKMIGHVIAVSAPTLLSYSWAEGNEYASEVTFELEAKGDMTLLTITHKRLDERRLMVGVASGWHTHVAILIEVLEGTAPAPFWQRYQPIETEYENRL